MKFKNDLFISNIILFDFDLIKIFFSIFLDVIIFVGLLGLYMYIKFKFLFM